MTWSAETVSWGSFGPHRSSTTDFRLNRAVLASTSTTSLCFAVSLLSYVVINLPISFFNRRLPVHFVPLLVTPLHFPSYIHKTQTQRVPRDPKPTNHTTVEEVVDEEPRDNLLPHPGAIDRAYDSALESSLQCMLLHGFFFHDATPSNCTS